MAKKGIYLSETVGFAPAIKKVETKSAAAKKKADNKTDKKKK